MTSALLLDLCVCVVCVCCVCVCVCVFDPSRPPLVLPPSVPRAGEVEGLHSGQI